MARIVEVFDLNGGFEVFRVADECTEKKKGVRILIETPNIKMTSDPRPKLIIKSAIHDLLAIQQSANS